MIDISLIKKMHHDLIKSKNENEFIEIKNNFYYYENTFDPMSNNLSFINIIPRKSNCVLRRIIVNQKEYCCLYSKKIIKKGKEVILNSLRIIDNEILSGTDNLVKCIFNDFIEKELTLSIQSNINEDNDSSIVKV